MPTTRTRCDRGWIFGSTRTVAGFVEDLRFSLDEGVVGVSIVFHKDHIGPITAPHQQSSREDHWFALQTAVGTRD